MLTWFAVILCAAPDVSSTPRSASLLAGDAMTVDEAAQAPPSLLQLPELEAEDTRLSQLPSISHPLVAVIGGGVIALVGGLVGGALWLQPTQGFENFASAFAGLIIFAVGGTGFAMAVIGSAVLPVTVVNRNRFRARRTEVHARLTLARAGTVAEPALDARSEAVTLESERPGLALPVILMVCGTAPLVAGAVVYAGTSKGPGADATVMAWSIALMVIGIAAEGIGIWQLITRMQTRDELDEKIHALEPQTDDAPVAPPASTSLPRVPMQLAWGWKF